MKTFVRRVAVVIGAVAVSAGLIGASAVPAHAEDSGQKAFNYRVEPLWARYGSFPGLAACRS